MLPEEEPVSPAFEGDIVKENMCVCLWRAVTADPSKEGVVGSCSRLLSTEK